MTNFKEEKGHEKEFHDESACYRIILGNGILTDGCFKCIYCICSS